MTKNYNVANFTWEEIIDTLMEKVDTITEIHTNGTTSLFIKESGVTRELKDVFKDEDDYLEKTTDFAYLISHMDRHASEKLQFLSEGRVRFSNGSSARVHIVLPPAVYSPQVTIAKKSMSLATLDSIMRTHSFNGKMFDFLKAMIACNLTAVISGGTGAGKTTILEALTRYWQDSERIGVVEDSPELMLVQPNVTYLHSTVWRPGMDRNDVATLAWCVQQINRMRTSKLIIGETRGGEFSDFIIGANSGMEGSLTTIHANNASAALKKMTQFQIIGLPQPIRVANESIAQAVDIIIQLGFNKQRKNRVLEIVEVSDTLGNNESATIATQPLFTYDSDNDSWIETGYTSDKLKRKLEDNGFDSRTFADKKQVAKDNTLDLTLRGSKRRWG